MASVKRFSSPIWTFSIPLLAGLLMAWGIVHLPFLVQLEHKTFVHPERFQKGSFLPFHPSGGDQFVVRVFDIRSKETPETNLTSYVVDEDTKDILGSTELSPANWTFLINSAREAGTKHLAITQSLSWENADELALRALDHELSQIDSYVVGINLRRGPSSEEFPQYLEGSVIPSPEGIDEAVSTVNQISPHPSIEAPI